MLFVFGQAEKGTFCRPTLCRSLLELLDFFGHPPRETEGLNFAVQTLLLEKPCVFFRVKEEGYSTQDYLLGLDILNRQWEKTPLQAIGLPGVGDPQVFIPSEKIARKKNSLLLITEKDLFDFLTT